MLQIAGFMDVKLGTVDLEFGNANSNVCKQLSKHHCAAA